MELTYLSCSGITWGSQDALAKPNLGSCHPYPIIPKQLDAQYRAARSWHRALVVPSLPGECVGRL